MKKINIICIMLLLLFSCDKSIDYTNNNTTKINQTDKNNVINNNEQDKNNSTNTWILTNVNEEISIEQLKKIFKEKWMKEYIDIGNYQSEISAWTKEPVFLLSFIKYEESDYNNWYIKKEISWQSDKSDITYSFYIKWTELYWIEKVLKFYEPAKSSGNPIIKDVIDKTCYVSLNDCQDDMLFLYKFIENSIKK